MELENLPFIKIFKRILIFLFIGFNSCQKEPNYPVNNSSGQQLTIEGVITGPNGMPLMNVTVKAGSQQVETDRNGSFRLTNVRYVSGESFVTASKAGFFTGSRSFIPRSPGNNFLKIQLLPRTEAAKVSSSNGGIVQVGPATVNFPANSFSNPDGSPYSGIVSVKAVYLDPTDPLLNEQMPGDLRGITTNGSLRGLRTFGMINVELEGAAGQRLNLKAGSQAQLSFPIPSTLFNTSPSTVPLWWFDTITGLWKEEGQAQKTGNRYTGNVSHFTFWNVDEPFEYVNLKMRIVSSSLPVQAARIELTSLADSSTTYDYTDQNGYVDGYVPRNVSLRREIYNECNALISSQVIGPFSTDTDLGNFQVNALTNQQTISGSVKNCNNQPLAAGYVIINMPGQTIYSTVTNGTFNSTFSRCSMTTTASLVAVDQATQQQGTAFTVNLSTPVVTNISLQACGVTTNTFLTISVNGVSRTWNDLLPYELYGEQDSLTNPGFYELNLGAYDSSLGGRVDLVLHRSMDSLFTPFYVNIQSLSIFDQLAAPSMLGDYFPDNSLLTIPMARISEIGPVGQFIAGDFTGRFIRNLPPTVDTVTVTASFRIRRQL